MRGRYEHINTHTQSFSLALFWSLSILLSASLPSLGVASSSHFQLFAFPPPSLASARLPAPNRNWIHLHDGCVIIYKLHFTPIFARIKKYDIDISPWSFHFCSAGIYFFSSLSNLYSSIIYYCLYHWFLLPLLLRRTAAWGVWTPPLTQQLRKI